MHVAMESVAVAGPDGSLTQCRSAFIDITARQLAEADLRRREENFYLLFDKAPLGYQSLDETGQILEVNQTWLDLLGYSREEVLSRWFGDFLTPGDQDLFRERFTAFKTVTEIHGVEWEMVRRDGATIVASFNGRVIYDEQGRFLRTHCLFEDITARKLAQETLAASEASYRAIFDNVNDAIFIHDAVTGAILDVNRKMEEMFGYTAPEARHLQVGQISSGKPPYTSDYALSRIRQAAAGEPQIFEWLCQAKNGRLFWVEVSLKRAVIGGQDRVLAIVRDNTVRKQAEEEINTTIAFLENSIAASVDPIAIVDEHGRFIKWNQAAAEAYGYSAEGLAGQTAFDLYADKQALNKMLRQLRRDGFVRGYEIDLWKKDGTIAPVSLSIGLFGDEGGNSIGSVCVARDLSEIRKSMAELSLVNAKLQGLVEEADKRNRELSSINSMAEKLQSCLSHDEAYALIAQHTQDLFPGRSGALFIQDHSTNLLEAVSTWGDDRGRRTGLSPH